MKFEIVPILDTILSIYDKPISPDRFHEYISTLKGNTKSDLAIPITGFNPMAKKHVVEKMQELKGLNAEIIIQDLLDSFNQQQTHHKTFKIFINVADDVKGGWTNHYTTDFDSKFKINALINRGFCTPYFWTSEIFSKELIQQRVKEYMFRTMFWEKEGKLYTLEDHVKQERFVANMMNYHLSKKEDLSAYESLRAFFEKNKDSTDYNLIFNFMYGDQVCETLSYPTHGIKNLNGFDFAKI